ncbi:MAG: hypothetical protein R3351_03675, partial [Nitrospirales bacterium]|nr:hypothetical protein [Nitrospirales bacterium]
TMNHAGMPSQYLTAKEQSPGSYETDLELTMAGDWVFFVTMKYANGNPRSKHTNVVSPAKNIDRT